MAVERVDYPSGDDYQQALQWEKEYYQRQQYEEQQQQHEEQEPDPVPCYGCGCPMYQENKEPKYNFCQKCKDIINNKKTIISRENKVEDLPF